MIWRCLLGFLLMLALGGLARAQDYGTPRVYWSGPRSTGVLGPIATMSGFRYAGCSSTSPSEIPGSVTFPLPDREYLYDQCKLGVDMPNLTAADPEMWVGVFAVANRGDREAQVRYVPFLRLVSYDNASGVASFRTNVGRLTRSQFRSAPALISSVGGQFTYQVVQIQDNSDNSIRLPAGLDLKPDDYVLPAPSPYHHFGYLTSLKLEYSTSVTPNRGNLSEWRNFVLLGRRMYSYTGNPWGEIQSTDFRALDFRHQVSPLATGVIVGGQAYIRSDSNQPAYLFVTYDAVHTVCSFGIDRGIVSGMGTSSNSVVPFFRSQTLWCKVTSLTTGKLTIFGWSEE
ncbi:hypothetical protein DYH09_15755 [bacterium CPR1]|nr:hypothetical protein [bacterium CPR1]